MNPTVLFTAFLVFLGAEAHAGADSRREVSVTRYSSGASGMAFGSMDAARHSADGIQYIYCRLSQSGSGTTWASCAAYDTDYEFLSCATADPKMVEAIGNTSPFDHINFSASNGTCTYFSRDTGSLYLP